MPKLTPGAASPSGITRPDVAPLRVEPSLPARARRLRRRYGAVVRHRLGPARAVLALAALYWSWQLFALTLSWPDTIAAATVGLAAWAWLVRSKAHNDTADEWDESFGGGLASAGLLGEQEARLLASRGFVGTARSERAHLVYVTSIRRNARFDQVALIRADGSVSYAEGLSETGLSYRLCRQLLDG